MRKRIDSILLSIFIITIFVAYVALSNVKIVGSSPQIFVRKSINYSYTFDISGNVISSRLKVTIVLKCTSRFENLTLVDKEYFMIPETVRMEKGPQPLKITKEGNLTKVIWSIKSISNNTIIFRFTAETNRMPPINFNVSISGTDIEVDKENNIIKNVEKGKILRFKIYVANNSTIVSRRGNETYSFPYPTNVIVTYPYKMLELIDYSIKPNLTSSQEDQKIVYWNVLLDNDINISTVFIISQLGVWKSVWIPPVNIQLSEDPYMIISLIKRSKIEEMYNETLKSYQELKDMFEILNSTTSNISDIVSLLRQIGLLQVKAASKLSAGLDTMKNIIRFIKEGKTLSEITERIEEAKTSLNQTLSLLDELNDLLKEYNMTEINALSSKIEEIRRSTEKAYKELQNMTGIQNIVSVLNKAEKILYNMSLGVRYMREAGLKQLELADTIEKEYYANISSYRDMLEEKLIMVNDTLKELKKVYDKYTAYKSLAYKLIGFLNESIEVYMDDEIIEIDKDFEIKDVVGIKMPLLASNLPKVEIEPYKETKVQDYRYIYVSLAVVVCAFFTYSLSKRRRKIVFKSVEDEKIVADMIEEIRRLIEEKRE